MKVIYVDGTLKAVDSLTDTDLQSLASRLVSQEIYHCCSIMVSELYSHPDYTDTILEFSCKPYELEPEEAANECDWYSWADYQRHGKFDENDLREQLLEHEYDYKDRANLFYEVTNAGIITIFQYDSYEECCAGESIDLDTDEYIEACEHWIVSSWLASRLTERGQMVGELFDFDIWGRTTTGQAICLDYVIQSIAVESYSFEQE